MNLDSLRSLRSRTAAVVLAGGLVAFAGCRGIATKNEKLARDQQQEVGARFRPGGNLPTLPILSVDSPQADFLRYAALRHPRVESAYYTWAASIERITVARSLPDPVFTLGIDVQKGLEEDVANMVMAIMAGVMVELPGPGKLRARADLQTEESRAEFARFQMAAIRAALDARSAYYDLFLVEERLRVTEKNLALLRDIEEAARRRSEAGLARLQDVLQAESDVARMENDRAILGEQRTALVAAWKSALGIPPSEADPPVPSSYLFTDEEAVSEATLADVLASSPRLRVLEADIKRAQAGIAAAYKSRVPDFSLGLDAEAPTSAGSSNPRDTTWKPRLGVTVPIWRDRIAAEIAEAEALKMAARADYSAEQLELAREFALNAFGIREATRNLGVLRGTLLPRQREIVELSQRGYQGGVTTFFELLDQQRRLLELELQEAEGRAVRERLIGELNHALVGRSPIDALLPPEDSPE